MPKEQELLYEPGDRPPTGLVLGSSAQLIALGITGLIAFPAIVIRAAGESDAYLTWTVFLTVVIAGLVMMLHASTIRRLGAGYILSIGPATPYIGISVVALAHGGPGVLATLVLISSLIPLAISFRLSLFRKVLTPTVVGTVNMLIPVTVLPVVFGRLTAVPDDTLTFAAMLTAGVTGIVICLIHLKSAPRIRLWAPVIGLVVGSVVGGYFGLYDINRVLDAAWIGLPNVSWPGLDFEFDSQFLGLIPAFIFAALIGTIQSTTSAVLIQRVSWRQTRAVDYRAVENTVAADGLGKLACGIGGIMPTQTTTVSSPIVEITGISARSVGLVAGAMMIVVAFFPKVLAVILAVPEAVYAAYLFVFLAIIFSRGMSEVVQGGIDHRTGLIAGLGFWVGVGCQYGMLFPEYVNNFAGGMLANGITSGGLVAILMTLFLDATSPRVSRLETESDLSALPKIQELLRGFATRNGWDSVMIDRLNAASEETLLTLVGEEDFESEHARRRLVLTARRDSDSAILEFVAAAGEEKNLQDRIGLLKDQSEELHVESEVSLRLLRHFAASVRHQKFHDVDILTLQVEEPVSPRESQ